MYYGRLPAYHTGATGLNQRRRAQIDLCSLREHADDQNKTRTQQTHNYDLQMGLTVGAIHRMIHSRLHFFEFFQAMADCCANLGTSVFSGRLATSVSHIEQSLRQQRFHRAIETGSLPHF